MALDASKQISTKAWSLLDEFRNFALKGNVVDLAVAVIIGTAFGKIVDSLVSHIIMPLVGQLIHSENGFEGLVLTIGGTEIPYGLFLTSVIDFLIVSLVLYIFIVKFLGWVMRTRQEATPLPPTKEEALLTEIRDLLKAKA